jgi:putative DNA primase/helicase
MVGNIQKALDAGYPSASVISLLPFNVTKQKHLPVEKTTDRGKTPAYYNGCDPDRWTRTEGWQHGNSNEKLRQISDDAGANAGLVLGDTFGSDVGYGFVDADLQLVGVAQNGEKRPGAQVVNCEIRRRLLQKLSLCWDDFLVRNTVEPRAGILVRLRDPLGRKKVFHISFDGISLGMIECLTKGQQFQLAGKHKSGNKISWYRYSEPSEVYDAPPADELPTLPDYDQLVSDVRAALDEISADLDGRFTYSESRGSSSGTAYQAYEGESLHHIVPAEATPEKVIRFCRQGKFSSKYEFNSQYIALLAALAACLAHFEYRRDEFDADEYIEAVVGLISTYKSPNPDTVLDLAFERERFLTLCHEGTFRTGWEYLLDNAKRFGMNANEFYDDDGFEGEDPRSEESPEEADGGKDTKEDGSGTKVLRLTPGAPYVSAQRITEFCFTYGAERTLHHQQGCYYIWRGTHYEQIPLEMVRADLYKTLHQARCNPNKAQVANVIESLAAVTQLKSDVAAPAWLDDSTHPDPNEILACQNGLLHLPKRELLASTPSFFGLNCIDYAYDPNAGEPELWLKFLADVWPDDQESIDCLQGIFGLMLTGETRFQKIFMLIGKKRCGKGTIARILNALLGSANVAGPTLSGLHETFGLEPLIGKPLAIVSDARIGPKTDVHAIAEKLLAISGEDKIDVRRMHRIAWSGKLPTRFMILSNELPKFTDASGALASRFIVLLMHQSFYGREDTQLTSRLFPELPSILNWSIKGWERLMQRGYFKQPASAQDIVDDFEGLTSPINAFVEEMCEVGDGLMVEINRLFKAWKSWCDDNGRDYPGTKASFGRDLRTVVTRLTTIRPEKEGPRPRFYKGLKLIGEPTAEGMQGDNVSDMAGAKYQGTTLDGIG